MDSLLVTHRISDDLDPVSMYRDLDLLSQQITEAMFVILNDPYFYSKEIYKFFNSH